MLVGYQDWAYRVWDAKTYAFVEVRSESAHLSDIGNGLWTAAFDARYLRQGMTYKVCIDTDGSYYDYGFAALTFPYGANADARDTNFAVTIPGIKTVSRGGLPLTEKANLTVTCEELGLVVSGLSCQLGATPSLLYLSTACDSSMFVASNVAVSEKSTSPSALTGHGHPFYSVRLDTRGLKMGIRYKLCEDLDGTDSRQLSSWKPTGFEIYTSAVSGAYRAASAGFASRGGIAVVLKAAMQPLELQCETGCTGEFNGLPGNSTSTAYLATSECNTSFGLRPPGEAYLYGSAPNYMIYVNAIDLVAGHIYKLCLDLDGADPAFSYGDTGLPVTVSTVNSTDVIAIFNKTEQLIHISCLPARGSTSVVGGCTTETTVYLGTACDTSLSSGAESHQWSAAQDLRTHSHSLRQNATTVVGSYFEFQVTLDGSLLRPGTQYRLCVDLDGPGEQWAFHDTGIPIYATPVEKLH
jgi:hypothetical protein